MALLDQVNFDGTTYEIVPEIAPLFSATNAYAVGDCVIYNAKLYRFKSAHAAGAWVGTDATEITVANELTDLKSDLNVQTDSVLLAFLPGYITTKVDVGATVDVNTITSSNTYVHCLVECSAGDKFVLTLNGGGNPRGWAFLDSEYKLISKSGASLLVTNLKITAPNNTAYAVFNSDKNYLGACTLGCLADRVADIETVLPYTYNLKEGTVISVNSDLDNYTTPGTYYVASGSAAATIAHTPNTSTSYKLIVNKIISATRLKQTVILNNANSGYERYYNGTTWSEWERIIYKSYVDALVEPIASQTQPISYHFLGADFEEGGISPVTGANATSTKRARSISYIDENIEVITGTSAHGVCVFCYNKSDDSFAGWWNGSALVNTDVSFAVCMVELWLWQ